MRTRTSACLPAVAALFLLAVGHPTPASAARCPAAKLTAGGRRVAAALACHAKAVGKGRPLDASCVATSAQGLEKAFAKAEAKGDCASIGDVAVVAADAAATIDAIVAALGGPGPSACTERKLKATGKKAAAKLACRAAAAKKGPGHGVDPKCTQKAEAAFVKAFAKAERKGDCLAGSGDAATIETLVDDFARASRDRLVPAVTTCTPLAASAVHGDGLLVNNRLAKIVNGKVPCLHSEEATAGKCLFSIATGGESGAWVETSDGPYAKVGQSISKEGLPGGDWVVAADVRNGPARCLGTTARDTSGRVPDGRELDLLCTLEDVLAAYNAGPSPFGGWSFLINLTDGIVCSADAEHPDLSPTFVGDGGLGAGVYCWTGYGAALNDPNGVERDWLGDYLNGPEYCHYIHNGGFEVPGAKRPAVRTFPAPGGVNPKTRIVWRPVTHIDIANVGNPPPNIPTPTATEPTATPEPDATATPTTTETPAASPTPTATATPTATPTPDLVVDTTVDDVALSSCDPETAADCSLRGAIAAAVARGTATRIAVPAGTYVLTATANCQHVTSQFGAHLVQATTSLCVAGKVTLVGDGATETIIDGNGTDRVMLVGNGGPVRVEGLTLRGGSQQGGSLFGGGGAINNGGDLTLADCVVRDSTATGRGGGIYSAGPLTIERCTVRGNGSTTGGGLAAESFNAPVDTTILDSTFIDNHASAEHGGAIFVYGGNAGGLTIVRGTSVVGNDAAIAGGGIALAGLDNTLVVTNSTLSGNRCFWYSGGGLGDLGRSTIQLRNVTITANRSEDAGGTNGAGGGIAIDPQSTVTLANTIVAGNTAPGFAPDCFDGGTTLVSDDYNLVGDDGGAATGGTYCDLTGGTGDLVGVDALLGPLADNGGPTETHAPLAGSPAIDAGDPNGCTDENGNPFTTDQRGAPRPTDGDGDQDARCDRGAVEAP